MLPITRHPAGTSGDAMTLNPVKIVDHVVAAARLDASRKRMNQYRHIAEQLRLQAQEYDTMAEKVMAAMKESNGHG